MAEALSLAEAANHGGGRGHWQHRREAFGLQSRSEDAPTAVWRRRWRDSLLERWFPSRLAPVGALAEALTSAEAANHGGYRQRWQHRREAFGLQS